MPQLLGWDHTQAADGMSSGKGVVQSDAMEKLKYAIRHSGFYSGQAQINGTHTAPMRRGEHQSVVLITGQNK